MLIEMLFGTIFFLCPVIAMFIAVIVRGLCNEEDMEVAEAVGMKRRKLASKRGNTLVYGGSRLVHNKVMAYQLIESRMHEPLIIRSQKRGAHPRAGP